jgi:transcriptional regulator with XRE-family HTH domain
MSDQDELERQRWKQFGAWLRRLRADKGYSQTGIAAEAHVGLQTLVSLERGGYRRNDDGPWLVPNPKDETLIRLARALGMDPEEIFGRVGRYEDRPQTKGSRRREDRRSSRLEELEAQNAELMERVRALEARQQRTEALLREDGIERGRGRGKRALE